MLRRLLPGLPEARAGELKALRYKPERRWVGVIEAEGRPAALMKVYRPEDVQRARAGQLALAGPEVPPLGWWPRRGILASTWVPGISLAHALVWDRCSGIEATGAALADIHRLAGRRLDRFSTDDSIEAVRAGAAAVQALLPALGPRAHKVAEAVAQGLAGAHGPPAVIHGDFSADPVVLADHGPVVIDFDQACVGDPAIDLGSFAADLERAEIEGRLGPGRAGEINQALIYGYRASGRTLDHERLELQRAAALLRLAVTPFRERRTDWPGAVEVLLSRAEAAAGLAGAIWAAGPGVVLQPGGADRRLKNLAALASRPDMTLVVHRPERRAVLRLDRTPTRYLKLVRPGKARELIIRHRTALTCGLAIPELIAFDPETGVLAMAELPGTSLHEMLWSAPLPALIEGAAAAGRSLRKLHSTPVPPDIPEFTAADEMAATARWMEMAAAYGVAVPEAGALMDRVNDLLGGHPGPACLVHRDLHDKQILLIAGEWGLLDLDTLAAGEAALDLANLLIHFELRGRFGVSQERARQASRAFLDGYDPPEAVMSRVPAYAASTRLRLACVYGFRPARAQAALGLLRTGLTFDLTCHTPSP